MLSLVFIYLVLHLLRLHHSGISAQEVETCQGGCPPQVVALQDGENRTSTSRSSAQLDPSNTEWSSQQGHQAPIYCATPSPSSNGIHRIPAVALWALQEACQGQTTVLSKLWIMVGRRLRSVLPAYCTKTGSGSQLDMERMARQLPETVQDSHQETVQELINQAQGKRIREGQREREGKRQGEREGQGNRGDLTLRQHSDVATACPDAFPYLAECSDVFYDGNVEWWIPIPARCRTYCGNQESLSGLLVAPCRDQGSAGQNGGCCHQRPPSGDISPGQGPEIAQRTGRGQREASNTMADAPEGCTAILATTDAVVRGSTTILQGCHCQGKDGFGPVSSVHPSLECKGSWEATPRGCCERTGRAGSTARGRRSRGKESQEAGTPSVGSVCPEGQRENQHHGTSGKGGCPERRRRKTSFGLQTIALYITYQIGWQHQQNVTNGSALTRLRSAGGEPAQSRHV